MAVRNRSTQINYVDELNADGAATQTELDTAVNTHLSDYHNGEPKSKWADGIEYYFDSANNRWLSKQIFNLTFKDQDTTTSNIYLYSEKNIRCNYSYNTVPFNKSFLIDKIEVSLNSLKAGNLFDVEDDNGNQLYVINTPYQKYTLIENVNIVTNGGIMVYTNNTVLRRPIVKIWLRLIF